MVRRLVLKTALHCLRDNALPVIPLAIYEGSGGRLLIAGEERWTRYFLHQFNGDSWTRQGLGSFRSWQIPAVLKRYASGVDLTIVRLDLFSVHLLRMQAFLRVPEWVRMVANVPAAGHQYRSKSVQRDLQVIRKHGLSWRISHDIRELKLYLERDYCPYTRLRHGEDAYVQSFRVLKRAFLKGGLLVIEQQGHPLAALVFERREKTLQMWAVACAEADPSLLSRGAMAAIYAFSFEYARSTGLEFVDMRGCRPSTSDSLYFVKRKWQARVCEHGETCFEFLLCWSNLNERIIRFLAHTPLIIRDGGYLSVLGVADAEDSSRWRDAGLHRFHALSPDHPWPTLVD